MGPTGRALAVLALSCGGLLGCGRPSPLQPDSAVTLTVVSARQTPPSGGAGSATLTWTEVLSASGGPGAVVHSSQTELRRAGSASILVSVLRPGTALRAGVPLQHPVVATGIGSALAPGRWEGHAVVEVRHPGGRLETLEVVFPFE